jgi:pimeloyl-ACP methyl ester carboxylesterase
MVMSAGCTGPRLKSEDEIAEFAAAKRAALALRSRTSLVRVDAGRGPMRLAIAETGEGDADRVIVLLHGVLSDSAVWRFMRADVADGYDLMAVDLPGSGRSDRPDPSRLGRGAYGPPMLARYVLAALRQRLAARGKDDAASITIVAHSLGGMVTLRMFADPSIRKDYADVLDRVDGLVLFTPADVAIEKDIPTFRAIAEVSDFVVGVANLTGLLRMKVAVSTRDGVVDADHAVKEEAMRMNALLLDRERRRASQAMIKNAVPRNGVRPDWRRIEQIVQTYCNVDVPVLIVWGARDELLPLSMGFKLQYHLPQARLHVINRGMHCLPVERPGDCARLVRQFVESGNDERQVVTWMDGTGTAESTARLVGAGGQ